MEEEKNKKQIIDVVKTYMQSQGFTDRKVTDTPTDDFSVVNRKYVNLNGLVTNRPKSSVASVGQKYFATDTKIQMTYDTTGWVNGVGSIVALNN